MFTIKVRVHGIPVFLRTKFGITGAYDYCFFGRNEFARLKNRHICGTRGGVSASRPLARRYFRSRFCGDRAGKKNIRKSVPNNCALCAGSPRNRFVLRHSTISYYIVCYCTPLGRARARIAIIRLETHL